MLGGFELGGNKALAWLTFVLFVGLWLAYIFLSIAHSVYPIMTGIMSNRGVLMFGRAIAVLVVAVLVACGGLSIVFFMVRAERARTVECRSADGCESTCDCVEQRLR